VVESGLSQVILTSHSPYLLDLLDLSHIVLVERINGQPIFTRPVNDKELQKWSKRFGPGKLYTMGRLSTRGLVKRGLVAQSPFRPVGMANALVAKRIGKLSSNPSLTPE
jgi:hypothetical protein